jgi:oxygen-dependent protoporphyrinogen oxidase
MSTIAKDGYVLDLGAGTVTTKYTEMLQLVDEIGVRGELFAYNNAIGFLRDGRVHTLRNGAPFSALTTPLLGLRSKLTAPRMFLDARKLKAKLDYSDLSKLSGSDTETVRSYADRRLTPELRDYVIDPTLRFLYGGELEEYASTELFFLLLTYLGGEMMSARSGIDFLARALASRVDVELNARVTEVEEDSRGVKVTWSRPGVDDVVEEADACVVSLTAHQMAAIYPQLDDERREIVNTLVYNDLWKIALGVDPAPTQEATFVQIPSVEDPDITGVIFEHNKGLGRAPAGKGLLSAYAMPHWCHDHADDDDARVADLITQRLVKLIPGVDNDVDFYHVTRWHPALLMARPGTWTSLARFHSLTPRSGRVQFAGDYIGGTSTNSALASGQRAAGIIRGRQRLAVAP